MRMRKDATAPPARRPLGEADQARRQRRRVLFGSAGLLASLVLYNVYCRQNHRVFVVSGYAAPLTVQIDGSREFAFVQSGYRVARVSEGTHRVRVTGETNQEFEFSIVSDFLGRMFDREVRVINPGGAAVLVEEEAVYSAREDSGGPPENALELHFGELYLSLSPADYVFQPFPDRITVDRGESVRRRRIDLDRSDPYLLFYKLMGEGQTGEALALARWVLERSTERSDLLSVFMRVAELHGRQREAGEFLAEGVAARPIRVQWHRVYQYARRAEAPQLVAEYEALLSADPTNAVLIYLRGRLAGRCSESDAYYARALAADPNLAYAHYAQGMNHFSRADWGRARPHLERALALSPEDPQFQESAFLVRLAGGDLAVFELELRARFLAESNPFQVGIWLVDVLAAQGKTGELALLRENFTMESRTLHRQRAPEMVAQFNVRAAMAAGAFEEALALLDALPEDLARIPRFRALVALGRMEEAVALFPLEDPLLNEPMHFLTVALGWWKSGAPARTAPWLDRAVALMNSGPAENRWAAEMLTGSEAPSPAAVWDLSLAPQSKAILAAVLACRYPEKRGAFLDIVRPLNFSLEFPHHLLRLD